MGRMYPHGWLVVVVWLLVSRGQGSVRGEPIRGRLHQRAAGDRNLQTVGMQARGRQEGRKPVDVLGCCQKGGYRGCKRLVAKELTAYAALI